MKKVETNIKHIQACKYFCNKITFFALSLMGYLLNQCMKKIIFGFLLTFCFCNIYSQSGSIDTSFFTGIGFDLEVTAMALQPDNKIIVGGIFNSYNGAAYATLARLNPNGTIDSTFFVGATGFNSDIVAIHVCPEDTSILVAGSFSYLNSFNLQTRIVKLDKYGSIDHSFNPNSNVNSAITAMAVDSSNGKIYIGGIFTSVWGVERKHIVRLMADGTLDTTFNVGTGLTGSFGQSPPYALKIQSDGKLLVGGDFLFYNGTLAPKFCRLNTDGSSDDVFNGNISGGGFNAKVLAIEVMPNGKIIVGGSFTNVLAQNFNKIACLNADGTLNTSFLIGDGISGEVYTIKTTPQNKILVGGSFNFYNNIAESSIIQLNENGTKDANFVTDTALFSNNFSAKAYSFIIQPDSNIVIGGEFNKYNDTLNNNIVRLIGKGVSQISEPELTTKPALLITNNSARLGGVITNDGNSTVTAQGVCWSTSPNPTIHSNFASAPIGSDDFSVFVYNLQDTTFYYVSAFAINAVDTAYGNQITFSTRSNENYSCGNVSFIYNGNPVTYGTVKGRNGKCWMDRNLGANRVAESINDEQANGDYFQWGRLADGHQLFHSDTTYVLSPTSNPEHDKFIISPSSPHQWMISVNNSLWDGLNAPNNPCPSGWRVPTQQEFLAEITIWDNNTIEGAYNSSLRLHYSGGRSYNSGGYPLNSFANYWTSTATDDIAKLLAIEPTVTAVIANGEKAYGASVRCIKDDIVEIEDSEVQNARLIVYPNPANVSFTLNFTGDLTQKTNLVFYNYLGQEIMQSSLQSNISTFDISSFSNGIYFIKVITNKSQNIERLIIQK